MTARLAGVMPALLTPFDADQRIDETSLRRLVRFNLANGADGLYVGGSTAETFLQTVAERQRVLAIAADEVGGRLPLIAHVGSISTEESRILAASAARCGYDAVSAVTPFYYHFTFREHCAHYRSIVDAAGGLPMVVYNIPAMTGVRLSLAEISELLDMPSVVALKQTSGDIYQMEQIRRANPGKIIYNGYDEVFLAGQVAGADGGIGSTYNVMCWRYKQILAGVRSGDIASAGSTQSRCNQIIDGLIAAGVFCGLKSMLQFMGIIDTPVCRQPFSATDAAHLPALRAFAQDLLAERERALSA